MGRNHDEQVRREIRENRGGARAGAGRPKVLAGPAQSKHVLLEGSHLTKLVEIRAMSGNGKLQNESATIRWVIDYAWTHLMKDLEARKGKP
jgi:hypothetical protein